MSSPEPSQQDDPLDEVFLDLATILELSPEDRRIAESRYRRLKTHLERSASAIAPYLTDDESLIYAQGSIATSTTILSGDEDDRFDVDAVVEIDVPSDWSDAQALDLLEEALQGFPGAVKIERCTRCIQLQFPNMHVDVTPIDRSRRIAGDRPGEIFHSPDDEPAYRVPANPWGFTDWFRSQVRADQPVFKRVLDERRKALGRRRLDYLDEAERLIVADAQQQDLPAAIPNRLDAQEAVALKLLKRFLNIYYEGLPLKRPPSIYLTKLAGDLGYVEGGLSGQLFALANYIAGSLRAHLANDERPAEVNPSYPPDEINDRWPREPKSQRIEDMQALVKAMAHLGASIREMRAAPMHEVMEKVDELFGERIGKRQRQIIKDRYDRRESGEQLLTDTRSGKIVAPAIITSREGLKPIPNHHFHPFILDADADDES